MNDGLVFRNCSSLKVAVALRSVFLLTGIYGLVILVSYIGGYGFWQLDSTLLVNVVSIFISLLLIIFLFVRRFALAGLAVILLEIAFQGWNPLASVYFHGLKNADKDKHFIKALREWVLNQELLENAKTYKARQLPGFLFLKLGSPRYGRVVVAKSDDGGRFFCFGSIGFKFGGLSPKVTWVAKEADDTYVFIPER